MGDPVKAKIENRLKELRELQRQLEQQLFGVRAVIGEMEAILQEPGPEEGKKEG